MRQLLIAVKYAEIIFVVGHKGETLASFAGLYGFEVRLYDQGVGYRVLVLAMARRSSIQCSVSSTELRGVRCLNDGGLLQQLVHSL